MFARYEPGGSPLPLTAALIMSRNHPSQRDREGTESSESASIRAWRPRLTSDDPSGRPTLFRPSMQGTFGSAPEIQNAPDQIRTGDLRLERPTLFGPPEGPVDH